MVYLVCCCVFCFGFDLFAVLGSCFVLDCDFGCLVGVMTVLVGCYIWLRL